MTPELVAALGDQVVRIGTPTLVVVVVAILLWKFLDARKARWSK